MNKEHKIVERSMYNILEKIKISPTREVLCADGVKIHNDDRNLTNKLDDYFTTYVQPIFDMRDWSIHGYEVLNRPVGVPTEEFYANILRSGHECQLDLFLLRRSLHIATNLSFKIFINMMSSSIPYLKKIPFDKSKVVLEISERERLKDISKIRSILRSQDIVFAIDDYGKGFSNIGRVVKLGALYVKIDRSLVTGIDTSQEKQKIVSKLVVDLRHKSKIIAEGIERPAELATLKFLGVEYGQGYLLGRPKEFF
jgi:EAL domain-containing protein (putative c-di-GMP-specific phosphodiesterase class I)